MTLLNAEAFDEIFTGFVATADHLEVRDRYSDPIEDEALRRYLADEPDDLAWMQPWLDQVRKLTSEGKRFRRVRVVTLPLSDYQRWGLLAICHLNISAGEDVKYLDRSDAADLPQLDYWLFDDGTPGAHAVEVCFNEADQFQGGRVIDKGQLPALSTEFQRAYERAMPAKTFAEVHRLR